jgi:hypothetical protein
MTYTPVHIDGHGVSLTSRAKLSQVRKALADAKEAKRYWPYAEWSALFADLERQEADLADDIRRTDEATYGKATLRPSFVNTDTGGTTRSVVLLPNDKLDMPHIDETTWECIKRLLASDGSNIEVDADYDVYVARRGYVLSTIPRFER